MTIKAKFKIFTTVAVGLLLIFVVFIYFTSQKSTKLYEAQHRAAAIVKGVFELNIMTNDFILHRVLRSLEQWWLRYNSTARLLIEAGRFKSPKEHEIIGSLRVSHKAIGKTFFQLVTVLGRKGIGQTPTSKAFEERLISDLSIKSQSMVSSAFMLAEQIRREGVC